MPCVSEFFGISVYLYYNDSAPPDFHARYGEHEAVLAIESLDLLEGSLPRRARNLVTEWALLRREELRESWRLARQGLPLESIEPLD